MYYIKQCGVETRLIAVYSRSHFIQLRRFTRRPNHYEVLGIRQDANLEEIKAAFYEKSKKLHPDNCPDMDTAKFVELKEAYDVLRRPADRRQYDMVMRGERYRGTRKDFRHPYHGFGPRPQYGGFQRGDWTAYWNRQPGAESQEEFEKIQKRSMDFFKTMLKWTIVGVVIVVSYNVGYLYMLRVNQKKLEKLIDEDEIAKSFLRQKEFQNSSYDSAEVAELGRLLKADIDEMWKQKCDEKRNPDEIREEYRWFRAVQDTEHIRSVKERRMARKMEEREKWRNEQVD